MAERINLIQKKREKPDAIERKIFLTFKLGEEIMNKLLISVIALIFPAFVVNVQAADKKNDLTDAEIVHIVVTANSVDIEAGNLAQEKASHIDIRSYAQRMIADHTASSEQAVDLAKKFDLTPKDNAISQKLAQDAKANMERLKGLSDEEFNKAYLEGEIKLHTKVIEIADNKLVPSVENEELKTLLMQTHPMLVSHLERAKELKSAMK